MMHGTFLGHSDYGLDSVLRSYQFLNGDSSLHFDDLLSNMKKKKKEWHKVISKYIVSYMFRPIVLKWWRVLLWVISEMMEGASLGHKWSDGGCFSGS